MPATTDPPEKPEGHRPKTRLERQIEEILERAERDNPLPPPISVEQEKRKRTPNPLTSPRVQNIGSSARRWLTVSPFIVAFLLAVVARAVSEVSPFLAHFAVSAAVIAFFWPILESIRNKQSGTPTATMWRGRDMSDLANRREYPTPLEQIRQWFRDRRSRP